MIGEVFQEFLSSLSIAVIVFCLVTIVFVLVPCSGEFARHGTSNLTAGLVDKEALYEQNNVNCQVVRDLGKGKAFGFPELKILPKIDDFEEVKLKGKNFYSSNTVADDNEAFAEVFEGFKGEKVSLSGVHGVRGEVLDECPDKQTSSFEFKDDQENPVLEVLENDQVNNDEEEEGMSLGDWEGVERSELEKLFGAAVSFVGSKGNGDSLNRNIRWQFYGLHKVATQGPCHGPPPTALKFSARAKWNAWQRLGNMNREMAMEQYLVLLSKSIPQWPQWQDGK